MSIQMVVCTPCHYFSDWLDLDSPEDAVRDFNAFLATQGVALAPMLESTQFCSVDLHAESLLDLALLCKKHSNEHATAIGRGLFIPTSDSSEFLATFRYAYAVHGEPEELELEACANSSLRKALEFVTPLIRSLHDKAKIARLEAMVTSHLECLKVSDQVRQPIFCSY